MPTLRRLLVALGCGAALAGAARPGLDCLARRAVIRAGERAAGAAVDVGSARLRPLSGRLELDSVAVADRRRPWRNLFQFDRAVLEFSPRALLGGCVFVREAGIDGLVAGGVRARSGALRGAEPSPFESMLEEQLAPAGGPPRQPRVLEAVAARLGALSRAPLPLAAGLSDEIRLIQSEASSLRAPGLLSQAGLVRRESGLADLQKRVQAARAKIQDAEEELAGRFEAVRRGLAEADDARAQDVNARLARQGVPELDAADLDRRLFGPAAAEVVVTGLSWVRLAQPRGPARASRRPSPAVIVETTRLSGKISDAVAGQDMGLEGMILGASSDPRLYGKPTRLIFKGEVPGGASVFGLQGTLEQMKPPGSAEVAFHYSGMSLSGAALGDEAFGAVIERGVARVNATLVIDGRRWSGRFSLAADGVRLSPRVRAAGPAGARAAEVLRAVRRFKVDVIVGGDEDDLRVKLASSLGSEIAAALLSRAPPRWLTARRKAEKDAGAACASREAAVRREAARLRAELLAPLERDRAALAVVLRRTEGQAIEASFPGAP